MMHHVERWTGTQGSSSDAAGIQQGDELLSIDGVPLTSQSPFQAASLLQVHASTRCIASARAIRNGVESSARLSAAPLHLRNPVDLALTPPACHEDGCRGALRTCFGAALAIRASAAWGMP